MENLIHTPTITVRPVSFRKFDLRLHYLRFVARLQTNKNDSQSKPGMHGYKK